jgi:hypothetical protein
MIMSSVRKIRPWAYLVVSGVIIATTALIELMMGRLPICKCGYVRFWVSKVASSENSQQIADWYSFSHLIHGFIFYGLLRLIGRGKWSWGSCLALAIFVEASWEVFENTPFTINRYRQTASLDYYGDSILNSISDILFCVAGIGFARILPVWLTLTLLVVMEVGVAYAIRDNLFLNIVMLIYPFESIKQWQMGG